MSVVDDLTHVSCGGLGAVVMVVKRRDIVTLPLQNLRISGLAVRTAVVGFPATSARFSKLVVHALSERCVSRRPPNLWRGVSSTRWGTGQKCSGTGNRGHRVVGRPIHMCRVTQDVFCELVGGDGDVGVKRIDDALVRLP
jgi:hypothetical protein